MAVEATTIFPLWARNLFNAAEKELDDAQKAYDDLLDTQAADDVLQMRAEVSVAQERYYAAT